MASAASSAKSQSQLQLVRDIAHSREQKLASEVGELIRQRASVAATMERLQGYLRDYQVGQSDHLARRLPEIENERRFVTRLNDALDQQCTHAQRLDASASAMMQRWQSEHANLQALDRLISQRASAQARLQDRHDQKESDARSLRAINKGVSR